MASETTARRGGVDPIDIVMLILAVVSVGLLLYVMFVDVSDATDRLVFVIDTSICGVFLLEFLWRWRQHRWEKWFPLRRWYEVLGMIPIAHPALRGFRLIRVVVVFVRLARTADRTFGELFTQRLLERLSRPLVQAIKQPVTIAVMDEVVKVLETGNYPQNLAQSLGENRVLLRTIVAEKLREDPQTGRLKKLPFHDEVVNSVVDTSMRVILDVLTDPRIDAFFAEVVRENRDQIREAIKLGLHERDAPEEELETALPTVPQRLRT